MGKKVKAQREALQLDLRLENARRRAAISHLRAFEAAKQSRRTEGWSSRQTGPNADIKPTISWLIKRHQDLIDSNPWCRRAMDVIVGNWIGDGVIGAPSAKSAKTYARMWTDWTDSTECDFYGRMNFYGLQELVARTVAGRGSALVRWRINERMMDQGLVPLQLQVMEPDWLDTGKDNGSNIIGGKQYDGQGRLQGYWVLPYHPGENDYRGMRPGRDSSELVAPNRMLHIYEVRRPHQYTGVPWGAAVILKARDLEDYHQAELLKQKLASCFVAFEYSADEDAEDTSEDLPEKLVPGAIERLAPGKQMQFAVPPKVEGYGEVTRMELHAIAAGYGISFEALTGILSDVNFSSARMGWLEFHRNVARWRWNLAIPQLLTPVHGWFRELAAVMNQTRGPVRMIWTPPRREMINPREEIEGLKMAIRCGLTTLSEVQRSLGYIPEELMAEFAADMLALDAAGIVLDTDPRRDPQRQQAAAPAPAV
jgi:lambda family phage portal protein